jgi:hypothetical protein
VNCLIDVWFLMLRTIVLDLGLDVSKARGEMSLHMLGNGLIPSFRAIKAVVVRYVGSAGQLGAYSYLGRITRVTNPWDMATIQVWQVSDSANHR